MNKAAALIVLAGLLGALPVEIKADQEPASAAINQGLDQSQKSYAPYPSPDAGYVTDLADLLSDDEEERIEQWLWQVESRTGVEMAVLTIQSIEDYPQTQNRSIEDFARGLFDAYGIGNLPKNDGALLVVAVRDRKARIELGAGYGHRRDGDANAIMQNRIIPHFKNNDYAGGILAGVKGMMSEFAGVRVGINWPLILIPVAIVVLGMIAASLFRSGKRGWGWVCVGLIIVLILALIRVIVTVSRHMPESSSESWSSGGFGGGFGGGFSGGGGATGSW